MRQNGIENLTAILRRSRWILFVLIVLGVVQMNVVRSQQGPLYSAHAKVILSPTDLATALAGLNTYVDPALLDQTEQALADSRQLFAYAAKRSHEPSASELRSGMTVTKSGTTINFDASSSSPTVAEAKANAVATAYPSWRAGVSNAAVDTAIAQLRAQIAKSSRSNADEVAQLNRLRLLKTLTSGNVLLVERATGSVQTRPRRVRDSLLGAFIGLFVALVTIGLREAFDTRIRSEQEVEEVLDVPVLGTVERLPRRASPIALVNSEYERYGDMYALLAASIARLREGEGPIVIAVTSATAAEGKTTTAVNVSTALARRNEDVCLIDLDTRRPSVAATLKIPSDAHGVDRALVQKVKLADLLWDVRPERAGMTARPAGTSTNGRSRLQVLPMGSSVGSISPHVDRLTALIQEASQRADYVIVDTPPALSVADVTELVKLADMVLVVVRYGQASRRNLDALRRLHRTWPAVDIRAVMVDTPADGDSYSYYARR
jgi:Mrp family chromosome partitioning ATPase